MKLRIRLIIENLFKHLILIKYKITPIKYFKLNKENLEIKKVIRIKVVFFGKFLCSVCFL